MNYCSSCGFKLPPKAKFCPQCGVAVNSVAVSGTESPIVQAHSSNDALTSSQKRLLSSAVLLAILVAGAYYYVGFVSTLDAKTIQHSADDGHNHPVEQQNTTAQQEQMPVPSAAEIQRVQQALENDPGNAELELQLGNMLFDSQRYREAIGYYTTVLAKNTNNADVRVDLGVSHFNLQDFKAAEEQFQLALKLQPKHLNGLYNMGIVSLKLGEVNKLISYWGKLIELAPESGQAQQAKKYLEELHQEIEQFPQDQQNTES
ncbi:MAG: tetratricopeptide repeat protein [Calditrichia bacterium]